MTARAGTIGCENKQCGKKQADPDPIAGQGMFFHKSGRNIVHCGVYLSLPLLVDRWWRDKDRGGGQGGKVGKQTLVGEVVRGSMVGRC